MDADGFFWDEPHYALPKSYASITGGPADDWACRCSVCKRDFEELYGYEMPKIITKEVVEFRQDKALDILVEGAKIIKNIRPNSKIICCVHATINTYYVVENRGYDNWDKVGKTDVFDVFSTTILNWSLPRDYFKTITQRTVDIAKKYKKGSQRWIMGYYNEPKRLEEIKEVAHLYKDMGVESLFSWTYRGGHGTVLAAPRALEVWDMLGEAYGEVLDEKYKIK